MQVAFVRCRVILGAAVLAAALFGTSNPSRAAEDRPADCELTVRGKTYIKGVCQFRPTGGGGFQISGNDYFAYVSITAPGVAEASWNESPQSTHAHSNLGTLKRKGACWVGANATICARELSPGKAKAVTANQPGGETLWPILPGLSACLSAQGRPEAGKAIVLHNCRVPADLIFVRRDDGSLGISKRPDLCVALENSVPPKLPKLIVTACRADLPRWNTQATSSKEDVVRSSDGLCLTIPGLDDPNGRFPVSVHAAPCTGGRAVPFLLSKG